MNQSRDSSKDLSLIQKSLAKNFAEHFKNACKQVKCDTLAQESEQQINQTMTGLLIRQSNEPQLIKRTSFDSVNESCANLNPCLESQNSNSYALQQPVNMSQNNLQL